MSSVASANGVKHTCQLCEIQTFQKTHLKLHIVAVHKGKSFQCPEFEQRTAWKSQLISHQKSIHMGQSRGLKTLNFPGSKK